MIRPSFAALLGLPPRIHQASVRMVRLWLGCCQPLCGEDFRERMPRCCDRALQLTLTMVICGTPDEVRAKVEPLWDVADSLCFVPPTYALDTAKLLTYGAAIAQTFYG